MAVLQDVVGGKAQGTLTDCSVRTHLSLRTSVWAKLTKVQQDLLIRQPFQILLPLHICPCDALALSNFSIWSPIVETVFRASSIALP